MESQEKEHEGKKSHRSVVAYGRGSESALYEVICPAVYVIRVFGLAPYEFDKDKDASSRLRPSIINCFYAFFWMAIYSYIVVTSLMRFGGLDRDRPVLGVTETGKLILNYVISLVDLILGILRRKHFVRVWNSIEDFDESFELGNVWRATASGEMKRGYSPMLRSARIWVWTVLVINVIIWTSINQVGMRAFEETYLRNVGYMLTYIGTCIAVFKLGGLIFLLGQRFAYLNDLLTKQLLIQQQQHERRHARQIKKNPKIDLLIVNAVIKKIETSYNKLLSTSEKLNDIYSCSLFLFLFNLFCHAVSNMYYFIIWTIVNQSFLSNPKVIICLFTWLLVYLIQLLLLHVACHYASLEANRTGYVLLNWRRYMDRHCKQNEFNSPLHYLNRKLNFTAAGCFNVDLTLFTSIFGHLTTYLVILLQLPDNSNR